VTELIKSQLCHTGLGPKKSGQGGQHEVYPRDQCHLQNVTSTFFPGAKQALGLIVSHSTRLFNRERTVLVNSTLFHVEALEGHDKAEILLAMGHVATCRLRRVACHVALPCSTQNRAELNVTNYLVISEAI